MTDQEKVADFLSSEKKMASNYDSFASECVNVTLRDQFIKLLAQGHQAQTQLFQTAHARGWYQPEQAPENKVSQAFQKYTNQQPK